MKLAMKKAGVSSEEIDYINAHGTSTPLNDRHETQAIKSALGEGRLPGPDQLNQVHDRASPGAPEARWRAVTCVQAMRDGIIPPTINLEHQDPDCDLDYTPGESRHQPIRVSMSNSFGFGGHKLGPYIKLSRPGLARSSQCSAREHRSEESGGPVRPPRALN